MLRIRVKFCCSETNLVLSMCGIVNNERKSDENNFKKIAQRIANGKDTCKYTTNVCVETD